MSPDLLTTEFSQSGDFTNSGAVGGRVLVAGIGNIFQRDDGFGVEVANRLAGRPVPDGVEVGEFGIRGVHLAYQLLDGYDTLILVDAVPMGEEPGTLAVIEPDPSAPATFAGDGEPPVLDAHTMNPDVVLGTLAHLGGALHRVYVVGCQPADFGEGIGLTPPVEDAVDRAVELCDDLLAEIMETNRKGELK